ncbi:hypothetical protein L6259_03075 [Candidatus Parcubacteria bacterium]|nr:hypothetical protein [Patescibacteria group bacterium]MCG2694221.1 hypothetical protein [Candidatus Parcubacteria bacterium]
MKKEISCPLCGKHKIDDNDLLYYIYFPYRKEFAVHTLKLESCPKAREMTRALKPIVQTLCAIWLRVSIYRLDDGCYRFLFRIIVKDKKVVAIVEERASLKFSLDQAIEIVDKLKLCLLAVFAEKIKRKNALRAETIAGRKDLAKQINRETMAAVADLYRALRLERILITK